MRHADLSQSTRRARQFELPQGTYLTLLSLATPTNNILFASRPVEILRALPCLRDVAKILRNENDEANNTGMGWAVR